MLLIPFMQLTRVSGQPPSALSVVLFCVMGVQLFDVAPIHLLWWARRAGPDPVAGSVETVPLNIHTQGRLSEVKALAAQIKTDGLPPLRAYAPDGEVECLHLQLPKSDSAVLEIKVAGIDDHGCVISSSARAVRMPLHNAINLHLEMLPLEPPLCSRAESLHK